MGHYLVHVNVLVNGRCCQMRFTADAASAASACSEAEDEAMRIVEGIELAVADRALRLREVFGWPEKLRGAAESFASFAKCLYRQRTEQRV